MDVKVKKVHPDAVMPKRESLWAAGYDLTAVTLRKEGDLYIFGTGIALEIPKGWFGALYPRSSVYLQPLHKCGGVTVIDADYRGEIMVMFRHMPRTAFNCEGVQEYLRSIGQEDRMPMMRPYAVGDRIAQIVFQPCAVVYFDEVAELSPSVRGAGGYGSTGL